jgi:PAT family beta-lactamase induction signal transducer AmpG
MGLSGASFGLFGSFLGFTLPQVLAAQHVPETTITAISAAALSPGFLVFLVSPMLDVRFSRRSYATTLTVMAATLVGVAVLSLHQLLRLEVAAVAGLAAICLAYGALGGWLSTVSPKEDENRLSAWLTVANIGAGGLMSVVGAQLIQHLRLSVAAFVLSVLILLPAAIFLVIPAPVPDRRLAGESFRAFWADVFALVRRREVLIAIALFVSPAGTFSLTNVLAGLGNDFHASPRVVSLLGGAGVTVAGICGSLLLPIFAKRMPLRPLYITLGAVGSIFTLSLILLPHTPASFAVALCGENLFQALAITCSIAVIFEVIGRDNPLAATSYVLLASAYNIPISYMPFADGWGYSRRGAAAGMFATDGGMGIAACLLMGLVLWLIAPRAEKGPALTQLTVTPTEAEP